jgi:hypothetical protein
MKSRGLTLRYGRVGALHLRKIGRRRTAAFEVGIYLGLWGSQGGGGSEHRWCTLVPTARGSRRMKKLVLGRRWRRRKMMEVLTVRHHQVGGGRGQGERGRPVTLTHPLHLHDHRWFKGRFRNVDNVLWWRDLKCSVNAKYWRAPIFVCLIHT